MLRLLNLSGGKDSCASYFLCRNEIDVIIYVDSGVDFPSIKKTALQIGMDFVSRGGRFEVLTFDFLLGLSRYGWPSFGCRWCTRLKISSINRFKKSLGVPVVDYIGIAYDEQKRCRPGVCYPLVDAKMTEKDALECCYSYGLDFGGVYHYFHRASCFCCPLGGLQHFRRLYSYDSRLFAFVGVLNDVAFWSKRPLLSPRFSYESIRAKFDGQPFLF